MWSTAQAMRKPIRRYTVAATCSYKAVISVLTDRSLCSPLVEQFNNLIEFRQAVYDHGLTQARDAQSALAEYVSLCLNSSNKKRARAKDSHLSSAQSAFIALITKDAEAREVMSFSLPPPR